MTDYTNGTIEKMWFASESTGQNELSVLNKVFPKKYQRPLEWVSRTIKFSLLRGSNPRPYDYYIQKEYKSRTLYQLS